MLFPFWWRILSPHLLANVAKPTLVQHEQINCLRRMQAFSAFPPMRNSRRAIWCQRGRSDTGGLRYADSDGLAGYGR